MGAVCDISLNRRGRARRSKLVLRPTDLSDVLDFRIRGAWERHGVRRHVVGEAATPLLTLAAHPGACFVPGALTQAQQRRIVRDAVELFPEAPATTNHTAAFGTLSGLWSACLAERSASQRGGDAKVSVAPDVGGGDCAAPSPVLPPASRLLQKLRWATLGPPFNWTTRQYEHDVPFREVPPYLRSLATTLADAAASVLGGKTGVPYCPDAAIVNYYRQGDTLGGHQDDAEVSLDQPIVRRAMPLVKCCSAAQTCALRSCRRFIPARPMTSFAIEVFNLDVYSLLLGCSFSVGCDAIFLLGGHTRDVTPTAVQLRSGDAIVLAGPARRCFHGVPRVFGSGAIPAASSNDSGRQRHDTVGSPGDCERWAPEHEEFISHTRINISVRAVR